MQNSVKTPGGLRTGSGPTYNRRGQLVTCASAFCDEEPTHVQELTTHEGKVVSCGAYCESDATKHIRPDAEVEAMHARSIKCGTQPELLLSDKRWSARPFNDAEQAEIDAIKRGELVETYKSPGVFNWEPPRKIFCTSHPDAHAEQPDCKDVHEIAPPGSIDHLLPED